MNLGTCVDRLCGEVFCSVTSSAAGTNSSSHCPVYSYIRPFTLRCKTLDEHLDAEHLHRLHFDSDEAMDGSLEKVLLPQNISNSWGHSLLQYAGVHGVSYGVKHGASHGVRYGVGHGVSDRVSHGDGQEVSMSKVTFCGTTTTHLIPQG